MRVRYAEIGTERAKLTKFRKALENVRTTIEEGNYTPDDYPMVQLNEREFTLERAIDGCVSRIEVLTQIYDAKRKTRAVLIGKAVSESVSESPPRPDPVLTNLANTMSAHMPSAVSSSRIIHESANTPQIAVGPPTALPVIQEEVGYGNEYSVYARSDRNEHSVHGRLDPVAEPFVTNSRISASQLSRIVLPKYVCEGEHELQSHLSLCESIFIDVGAGHHIDSPQGSKELFIHPGLGHIACQALLRSFDDHKGIGSAARRIARVHQYKWASVVNELTTRFCHPEALIQSFDRLKAKLRLVSASDLDDYIINAQILFTSFEAAWGGDKSELRSLIRNLVDALPEQIRRGVVEKLVADGQRLGLKIWFDCCFTSFLNGLKITCNTEKALGFDKTTDKVRYSGKAKSPQVEKPQGESLNQWVEGHLGKGYTVKVLDTQSKDTLDKILKSEGFVGHRQWITKVSRRRLLVVVFKTSDQATSSLTSLNSRDWVVHQPGQGKGQGRKN
jgi:hypothetical protein